MSPLYGPELPGGTIAFMFTGIEHSAIASPDPEKLARWYVDTLGFEISYFSEKSKTTFVRAANGAMIEIIRSDDKPRPATEMRTAGLRHLAISVSDFEAAYRHLQANRVNLLTEPETKSGASLVFFTDPDGNILHLVRREKPL